MPVGLECLEYVFTHLSHGSAIISALIPTRTDTHWNEWTTGALANAPWWIYVYPAQPVDREGYKSRERRAGAVQLYRASGHRARERSTRAALLSP